MWVALSTASSCHRIWQSISKSTRRPDSVCFALYMRKDIEEEIVVASPWQCTYLLTMLWASGSFWLRETSPNRKNLLIYLILICLTFFFSFSLSPRGSLGDMFWRCGGHQESCRMQLKGILVEFFQLCLEVW